VAQLGVHTFDYDILDTVSRRILFPGKLNKGMCNFCKDEVVLY
jgi:hypothetical protein